MTAERGDGPTLILANTGRRGDRETGRRTGRRGDGPTLILGKEGGSCENSEVTGSARDAI